MYEHEYKKLIVEILMDCALPNCFELSQPQISCRFITSINRSISACLYAGNDGMLLISLSVKVAHFVEHFRIIVNSFSIKSLH